MEAVLCNKRFYQMEVCGPDAQRQCNRVILELVSPAGVRARCVRAGICTGNGRRGAQPLHQSCKPGSVYSFDESMLTNILASVLYPGK